MGTTAKKKAAKVSPVAAPDTLQLADIEVGEVFSEMSHYKVVNKSPGAVTFLHVETNREVHFEFGYVQNCLKAGDHFFEERKVGKEDKLWTQKQIDEAVTKNELSAGHTVRIGDVRLPGIRSIFEGIHDSHVFTVIYETQPTKRTKKELDDLRRRQADEVEARIDKAKKSRKALAPALLEILAEIQENPITDTIPGHESTLRGYKIQFTSRDGRYDCVNLDITDGHNVRPVNINTIKELCYDGIRYVVE